MKNIEVAALLNEIADYLEFQNEPFKVIKERPAEGKAMIGLLLLRLAAVAACLEPFLPRTAEEILRLIREHKMPKKPLFGRLGQ